MNKNEILPSPELPQPQGIENHDSAHEAAKAMAVEKKAGPGVSGSGVLSATGVSDAQSTVQGAIPTIGATTTAASTTQIAVPDDAGDVDLIEKEWVKRAKSIVDATMGDPYTQNKQINKMKVDYIKKRYDKDIKFKEE